MNDLKKWRTGFSGERCCRDHHDNEIGIWAVYGEDPNCDLGGQHYEPLLGYFTGTFGAVSAYAVTMKGFWQWGSGGRVEKIEPIEVPDIQKVRALKQKESELEFELKEIKKQLEFFKT